MSLRQFKHIGSVGRFRACAAEGDVTFKKLTLIFGENGRGKTTLCSILRSLQTNNPDIVIGRKTLGSNKDPNIVINFEDGAALFKGGAWSKQNDRLRIFDAQYIAENVYFGDEVGTDQRRNLCRVIIGKPGVDLASAYHDVDGEITAKNTEIRDVRQSLTTHLAASQIDQFIALEKDINVDAAIDAKSREVEGLKEIDTLRTRATFQMLDAIPIPTRLEEILGKTLEDVSRDAEAKIKKHLAAHGMTEQENWLSTGLKYAKDDCPFCGQSLKGLDLIAAYRSFFNAAYEKFRTEQEQYHQLPAKHYSDDKIAVITSRLDTNVSSTDVWTRYVMFTTPTLTSDIAEIISTFREELIALLDRKGTNLLAVVRLSPAYREAYQNLTALKAEVDAYNATIEEANKQIEAFKRTASPARLVSAQNELKWLQLTKKRHEPAVAKSCDAYTALKSEKDQLDAKKVDARKKLDQYSSTVVDTYLKTINGFLKKFTAGFRLAKMKVEYSGRVPNSTFCVVINETEVETGTIDTPLDEPSFRNTLSSGDRSTLALAFFLAQIKADAEKVDSIIVFDDPFNSQDQFRRTCTMGEIRRCGREVAQVIVMSHDSRFLRDLWEQELETDSRKALWLLPFGHRDTVIAEWSIETDTESEDAGNRRVLLSYYHEGKGNPRDVIKKLRPIIETHLKRMAPALGKIKGLGAMLGKVREDGGPPILFDAYDDLDDVNNYTRKYMHGEGQNPDTEPVHATELLGFVGKVLEIAGALTE
jgi:wobble nucleotide-excising tRNase